LCIAWESHQGPDGHVGEPKFFLHRNGTCHREFKTQRSSIYLDDTDSRVAIQVP
jgi:hypothetical protein